MRRPQFRLSTLLWITLAAVTGIAVFWRFSHSTLAFDAVTWQEKSQVDNGVRLTMADWLVTEGTLYGKTRVEVIKLLGEPPSTDYFRQWDLVYWLGPERGFFSIDSEWLVVRFGGEGRVVTEYRIVRD